jgi:hypothetical protein
VRRVLHHRSIHERSGIAFVAIANHIFLLVRHLGHGSPFQTGGITRTTTTPKTTLHDRSHYLGRGGMNGLLQSTITAFRDVILDPFWVDSVRNCSNYFELASEKGMGAIKCDSITHSTLKCRNNSSALAWTDPLIQWSRRHDLK